MANINCPNLYHLSLADNRIINVKPLFKMKVQLKPSTKPTYHKSSSQLSFLPSSWFKTCDKHAMLILLSSKSLFRKKVEHIFLNMDTIKPILTNLYFKIQNTLLISKIEKQYPACLLSARLNGWEDWRRIGCKKTNYSKW